jgi:aspartate aminotransferase
LLDARVATLAPSPTLASAEQTRAVHRLGLGQSPFPVPDCVVRVLAARAGEKDYLPVRGLPELRRAYAVYLERRFRVARGADQVLIGPGSKELMFLLQFCFAGELLIPAPAWVSYAPQARLCGRSVRFVPTRADDGYLLDADTLARACRQGEAGPRMLILNHPSNPTGCSFDPARLEALAAVCREHQLVVLSDEIYGELRFDGTHRSLAEFYEEGTIVSSGLSKWCGAGGWRLGAFSVPGPLCALADAIAAMGSETYSAACAPVQYAAVRAFELGAEIEQYLDASRRVLGGVSHSAASSLRAAGLDVPPANAGFYLFPGFERVRDRLASRGIRDDLELARRLLDEAGVVTLAGRHFGLAPESLRLRLSLVEFDGQAALAAAATHPVDDDFLRAWCAPTLAAITAIASWLG